MNEVTLAIVLPLAGAFLRPTLAHGAARWLGQLIGPLTLLGTIAVLITAWLSYQAPFAIALGGFAAPLGIVLYVDTLALLFALAVPVVTLLVWPRGDDEATARRQALTLLLSASLSGLALSGDLFNLYVFYELAAVATYGLVGGAGSNPAFVAALRYLLLSALGSVVALLGIALIYFTTGTLNLAQLAALSDQLNNPLGLAAFALILIGFGVKAELFPVNGWVPEVYSAVNGRLAALLAGLASKFAVIAVVRILILAFPHEEARQLLLVLGVLGVLFGELAAWQARDVTRMLAWSSVGQLGLVFIAFSLPGEAGLMAGVVIAVHHLVVKSGLFLLTDGWGSIERLSGAVRNSRWGVLLFVLFGLSLLGVPPLPGFWGKFLVLGGLANSGDSLPLISIAVILLATVLETAYLGRVLRGLYRPHTTVTSSTRPRHLVASSVFATGLLVAVALVNPAWLMLQDMAASATDRPGYVATVLGGLEATP